jgi:hypothetical protein
MATAPTPADKARGPYSAAFGAIHHEDAPGFLFTVAPDTAAPGVADAMNRAYRAEKETGRAAQVVRAALHDADDISARIQAGGYRANLSDVETLRNHVRRLAAAPMARPDTDCVSLLADLDAGKPVQLEAAATLRAILLELASFKEPIPVPEGAEKEPGFVCRIATDGPLFSNAGGAYALEKVLREIGETVRFCVSHAGEERASAELRDPDGKSIGRWSLNADKGAQ